MQYGRHLSATVGHFVSEWENPDRKPVTRRHNIRSIYEIFICRINQWSQINYIYYLDWFFLLNICHLARSLILALHFCHSIFFFKTVSFTYTSQHLLLSYVRALSIALFFNADCHCVIICNCCCWIVYFSSRVDHVLFILNVQSQ